MGLQKGRIPKNIEILKEKGKIYRFKKGEKLWLGKKHSEETKNKLRLLKLGVPNPNKGKKFILKKREYKTCPICKKEFTDFPYRMKVKKYCSSKCANKVSSNLKNEQRNKFKIMAKAQKGIKYSEDHKKNISKAKKETWQNKEYRLLKRNQMEKIYEKMRNRKPEEHPNWKGGISFEDYDLNFNDKLKRLIRERDNYTCQLCLSPQYDIAFDVHHIDYNKKNSIIDNLITLCHRCHTKTNGNRRKEYERYLKLLITIKKQAGGFFI